jgi:hypothetical protein
MGSAWLVRFVRRGWHLAPWIVEMDIPLLTDEPVEAAPARRPRFVGREAERALFARLLEPGHPASVLFLHGAGGMGKTTLLAEFGRIAEQAGRNVVELDARHIEPVTDGFVRALNAAAGGGESDPLPLWPDGLVLLLDTFEQIASLEHWLLEEFLPGLPADAVVVLAGRTPAGAAWRDDPGWAELAVLRSLTAFEQAETDAYLHARCVPEHQRAHAAELSRGHPLALSLVAAALQAGRDPVPDAPAGCQQLLRELITRCVDRMPTPLHQRAFHVLIFARSTTEAMLADAVDAREAPALYDWLRRLPFVEENSEGLMPHDLVRESFEKDWFQGDPMRVEDLRRVLINHVESRILPLGSDEHFRITRDWFYLVRDTPVGQFVDWTRFDTFHADMLRSAGDEVAVLALALQTHGPGSAQIVRHWLQRQPQRFRVTRDRLGRVCGFALVVDLARVTEADCRADLGIAAVMAAVASRNPLQPGGVAEATRFIVHETGHELPNPTFDLTTLSQVTRMLTERQLAWSLHIYPDIDKLAPLFSSQSMRRRRHWHHRMNEADFVLDGKHYGVFARDWRTEPNPAWHTATAAVARGEAALSAVVPLTRDAFAAAVREALRNHARPDKLQASPLLHSACLRLRSAVPDVDALRAALLDAVHALARHPADRKFHDALRRTWLAPAGASQEKVAAELGLPFNTYRYHLARGLDRVVQAMWQQEMRASRHG